MSYASAIHAIEKSIHEDRQRRKLLISLQPVIENLDAILDGYTSAWNRASYSKYLYDQPGFTSESNPELLEILEAIEEIISPLGEVILRTEDNPADNERYFFLTAGYLTVTITAVLSSENPSCQRQVIGYEEVEQRQDVYVKVARPIYKFVC